MYVFAFQSTFSHWIGELRKKLFSFILASKIASNARPKVSETTRSSLTVVCATPTGWWFCNRVVKLGPGGEAVVVSTLLTSACDDDVDIEVVVVDAVTPPEWGSPEL